MIAEGFEEIVDGVFDNNKGVVNKRQKCNRELIEMISYMVENHPNLRFGQILMILEVNKDNIDLFNEESFYMLERIKKKFDLFKT